MFEVGCVPDFFDELLIDWNIMFDKLKRKIRGVFHEHWAAATLVAVKQLFYRHWAAAMLVAVFVVWCVAMHLKWGL